MSFELFKKVDLIDKYNFYEYVSSMIDGGVPITEALESVADQLNSVYFKQKINELITYISSGDSFSKSMKKIPHVFGPQEIALVEAWETTGSLTVALLKISVDLKKAHNLRSKIKSSLTYPTIIFLFLFAAIFVVLTYVIPSIKPLFDNSDVELPMATQMLVGTSDFIAGNIILIILSIFAIILAFMAYKASENGRKNIETFLLWMPLIGKVYKNYILANIAGILWNLVGAGVNIIRSLTLVGRATNNKVYEEKFELIIERISKWEKIVDSMRAVDENAELFPKSFLQMLHVGEKTASLDSICEKLSKQYEKEVEYSLASLTKWIEPLAILLAGVFVVWFAFAIFGAILKITQVVG